MLKYAIFNRPEMLKEEGLLIVNFTVISLILLSVLLSAIAQIILKMGMSSTTIQQAIATATASTVFYSIVTNIYVIGGLALYFSSAAVWLFVLAKLDVSFAYPFVGLGFILTMLLAYFINGEALSMTKVAGTLFISVGIAIIARG